ncbi:MAG TPA: general secretion pathway protein GspB [Verrucomicrobia bacterium]|nr:general secretion pathway protein GspB [Verrucomicrobiota bacterium]HOP96967.1 hypothetical protein [Verrucomicrobiota bacterium]HPU57224.1 hypothetical protein [Verrucomicrobiota bacterium]
MTVGISWRVFWGFFVAFLALFVIAGAAILHFIGLPGSKVAYVCSGIVTSGLVLVLIGYIGSRTRRDASDHPLRFLKRLDFWGALVVIAAVPACLLARTPEPEVRPVPPPPVVQKSEPPPPPPPAPPLEFPTLRVRGLVCNGDRSSAVINGRTVQVGEVIEGVTLVAVEEDSITVELQGQRKTITLDDSSSTPATDSAALLEKQKRERTKNL